MSKKKRKELERNNKQKYVAEIIQLLSSAPTEVYSYKQIVTFLKITSHDEKLLLNIILDNLCDTDVIALFDKNKFQIKTNNKYITGVIEFNPTGNAYVLTPTSEDDIFIHAKYLNNSFHGDTVKVYLFPVRKGRKKEGEVVEVIKRGRADYVGRVEVSANFAFLIPDNNKLSFDIFIPLSKLNGAKHGDKAIAKLTDWGGKKNPTGEIIEVLGKSGDNNTEMHAILAEFDLPYKFPPAVEKAADKIDIKISEEEIKKRRDFRKITTLTIDPTDAKDFDDALSIEKLENGNWEIGIHIADVSHYVKPGTILDDEAYNRATSVYLVDRVVPMLPEVLSNNVCSLRPNEEKLCFSAVFEMDAEANVLKQWFGRTIINSDKRFTYEGAQSVIETGEGEYKEEIITLNTLAKKLRAERFKKGSIAFEKLEVKFHLDENGNPTGVYIKHMKDSNQLIEEFMLLANKKVAEYCGKKITNDKNGKAQIQNRVCVYRIHDAPNETKLDQFSALIARFGYKIKTDSHEAISSSLNKLMKDIKDKKEENMIEQLAIRTMAKAIYSTKNVGHYGLSFDFYSHFTSPIRRYPDVMLHRLLEQYLAEDASKTKKMEVDAEVVEEQCKHSSEMEKRAADAERASIKYKQVQYMADKIGQEFEGLISGVTDWGIFVEIVENRCEGLIRYKDLGGDVFEFDEENYCVYARRSKIKYQLGDKIMVKIKRADLVKKQLDFEFLGKKEE